MSDPAKYRTREEVQKMREEQDPIEYIKKELLDKNIYDNEKIQNIDDKIRAEINDLADKAKNAALSKVDNLYKDVLFSGEVN